MVWIISNGIAVLSFPVLVYVCVRVNQMLVFVIPLECIRVCSCVSTHERS